MYHTTVINPTTNRKNNVRVFPIATSEAAEIVREKGVKALSWHLLDQPESVGEMGGEMGGESAKSNFALSVFEHALDWSLGHTVTTYVKAFSQRYPGKQPKEVRVAVNRNGDTFIVNKEGKIIFR